MTHNIMIFLYEIFDVRNTDSFASYNFVIWNIHLKRFVPHPNVSEFYLLSYLTPPPPFIHPYRYIRRIIGVQTPGRQQL